MVDTLTSFPTFVELARILKDREVHIVGGTVRDLFLQREVHDLDLIVPGDAIAIGRSFTRKVKIPGFPLHTEMGVFRAVPRQGYTIDFTAQQGRNLDDDLHNRDFTINAIAVPLDESFNCRSVGDLKETIIDPTGGCSDLDNRTIRMISSRAFREDPLRLLRAYRFVCELLFAIEPETVTTIKTECHHIVDVSRERLYQEIIRILNRDCRSVMRQMTETGLLQALLVHIGFDGSQLDRTSFDMYEQQITDYYDLAGLTDREPHVVSTVFRDSLGDTISGGMSKRALFTFFLLLSHRNITVNIEKIGRNLSFSREAIRTLLSWSRAFLDCRTSADRDHFRTTLNIRSFLFHHREAALFGCLAYLVSTRFSIEEKRQLLGRFITEWERDTPDIDALLNNVDGRYIMEKTGLKPGKLLGEVLTTVREAIYTGQITTLDEVDVYVSRQFSQ